MNNARTAEILELVSKKQHNKYTKYTKDTKDTKDTSDESLSVCSSAVEQDQSQKLFLIEKELNVAETESVISEAPKLEIERLQKVSYQLYKNDNGTSLKGDKKHLFKMNIQFKINGQYYDFVSEVNTRLDSFKRFGDHITDDQKIAVLEELDECRTAIADQYNIKKTSIKLGKMRKKGKKFKKGHSYKSPSIANTFLMVWYDKTTYQYHFAMRFENVWIEDVLIKEDLTMRQVATNVVGQHLWYPEPAFKKDEVWKAEW